MERVAQGGLVTLTATYQTGTGDLADPVSPTVDIIDADDVELVTADVPTRVSLGTYSYAYTVPVDGTVGIWRIHWSGTVDGLEAGGDDWFNVVTPGEIVVPSIVSLAEAKDYLNFSADTSHDIELERFITAADPVIEDIVGPVLPTVFDEFYDGGRSCIILRHYPVISIQAVTEYAGAAPTILTVAATPAVVTGSSYVLDPDGILYRGSTVGYARFSDGFGNIRVEYTAGRAPVPANIKLGALELIRHLYQSTQQGGRPQFGGAADDLPWAPAGFAVPTRVVELLAPYRREPRIA